jgi:hypothetical protein
MAMTSSAIRETGIRNNGRHPGVALLLIATAQLMVVLESKCEVLARSDLRLLLAA